MQNIALIVAAGRGTRANQGDSSQPKQYINLGKTPVLSCSIAAFAQHNLISAIAVVIHPDDHDLYQAAIPKDCPKLLPPVHGGATRQHSVLNGLQAISSLSPETVLIHDAARPFIQRDLITQSLTALETFHAVLPALAVTDTLKREKNGFVTETLARDNLWRAQTPQFFRFQDIYRAHQAASSKEDLTFTDDASIAEWHGLKIRIIEGSETNRKLTTPEDLIWAQNFISSSTSCKNSVQERKIMSGTYRVGSGFDVHAFTEGDHVMLCGVPIAHNKSLKGHSDADVGLHALTDALLGAIGDGDIGTHFPPSDPKWKGAASDLFLKDAVRRVQEAGGQIQNIDITLICEAPKIGPHRETIRRRLADIMDLELNHISIKATTTETLGFTGRREGIAAMATVSVWMP